MEPTRTASFDDEMYTYVTSTISAEADGVFYDKFMECCNEEVEQRIADSHDITKSNFGFNP